MEEGHSGSISYVTSDVYATFFEKAYADVYPPFALRSVLGKWLKTMHCVSKNTSCSICVFKKTCSYAFIFDSPIEKNTPWLEGRDKSSHPFRIICNTKQGEWINSIQFSVQLMGKAIDYLPHIIYAFIEAGKNGLFRQRAKFKIDEVLVNEQKILADDSLFLDKVKTKDVFLSNNSDFETRSAYIKLSSPLRFKYRGVYSNELLPSALLDSCNRRAESLIAFFGYYQPDFFIKDNRNYEPQFEVIQKNTKWLDYKHWSGRQQNTMLLGGIVGELQFEGRALVKDWEALSLCGILGAGKNTGFGFGNMEVSFRK